MARIISAVFNPTSFQEYIAPLQMYGEEYKRNEAAIAELESYAANLAERAAKEPNEKWAQQYRQYANKLQQASENMNTRGLSPKLRSELLNIRRSYYRDIYPIQEAVNTQLELAKQRNAQSIAHPEYRTEWGAIPSVSALLETPTLGLTSYSGAAIEKSAQEAAAAAAMRHNIIDTFEPYKNYWMQQVTERGFTEQEVQNFKQAIAQNPEANGILENIFRQVKSQYKNFEGMDRSQKAKLEAEIINGIFKGAAYNKEVKYSENAAALKMLDHSLRMKEMREQQRIAAENANQRFLDGFLNDLNLPEHDLAYTPEESDDLINAMAEKSFDYLLKYTQNSKTTNDAYAKQIRRYFDQFRIKEGSKKGKINVGKALEHIKKYGLTDSGLIYNTVNTNKTNSGKQLTFLGNKLRQHLRKEVTQNEDIINEWTRDPFKHSKEFNWTNIIEKGPEPVITRQRKENLALDKDIFKGEGNLKINSYSLNLNDEDKKALLHGAIGSNTSEDYAGVYNIRGVDKDGIMQAKETRIKYADLPHKSDGSINWGDINVMAVNGGLVLNWEGKQGFIPEGKLGKQNATQQQVIRETIKTHLPQYLNRKRKALLQQGYNAEQVNTVIEKEKQSIMKSATQNSVIAPLILNKLLSVTPQTIQ